MHPHTIRMVHLPTGTRLTILPALVTGVAVGFRGKGGEDILALGLAPAHRPEHVLYFGLDAENAAHLRDLLDAALREWRSAAAENN